MRDDGMPSSPRQPASSAATRQGTLAMVRVVIKDVAVPLPSVSTYPDQHVSSLPHATWYLYTTALFLLLATVALFIGSFFVDRAVVTVPLKQNLRVVAPWALEGVCTQGCDVSTLEVNAITAVDTNTWHRPYVRMLQSAAPFSLKECLDDATNGVYNLTVVSELPSAELEAVPVVVNCSSATAPSLTTFVGTFRASIVSYGLVGGPSISGSDAFGYQLPAVFMYLGLLFASVALLLFIAVIVFFIHSRYTLEHYVEILAEEAGESNCFPPVHLRRPLGATIAFVALDAAMCVLEFTLSHVVMLGFFGDKTKLYYTLLVHVPPGFYGLLGATLAVALITLVPLCIIHSREMW